MISAYDLGADSEAPSTPPPAYRDRSLSACRFLYGLHVEGSLRFTGLDLLLWDAGTLTPSS